MHPKKSFLLITCLILAGLQACQNQAPTATVAPLPTAVAVSATATLPKPTPTSEPLAATVNGEGVSKAGFEAELARLQAAQTAQGISMTSEDQRKIVLDELVGQTLLSQAARDNGFVLAESDLQSRITALANKMGGADALAQWQTAHGYTPAQFESSLARSIAADWMSARIQAEVPTTAEQVHARQILVFDEDSAQAAISRLKAGTEFATLAYRYETVTGGDLGWFPKGYLTAPEVEEAAFALQAGEVSGIIKSSIGYHIVQVIERDSQRALSPDALQARQIQVIKDWIASKMAESQVVILP